MKFITGAMKMPKKWKMKNEMERYADACKRNSTGYSRVLYHYLGMQQKIYFKTLADSANIKNIPDVYADIFIDACKSNSKSVRDYKYTIIDDDTFEKHLHKHVT